MRNKSFPITLQVHPDVSNLYLRPVSPHAHRSDQVNLYLVGIGIDPIDAPYGQFATATAREINLALSQSDMWHTWDDMCYALFVGAKAIACENSGIRRR